ncbi:unnamed protein product [Gulo gulo]|uniref:Uncharacterized protein n=1 Tax=Gulo gulo TaxID=48420 RepID=A0A9X9Q3Q8_GULGU|nr:unnamed protein product [Gulo gulo]
MSGVKPCTPQKPRLFWRRTGTRSFGTCGPLVLPAQTPFSVTF